MFSFRRIAQILSVAATLAAVATPSLAQSAPAPIATGTLRAPSTNAAWGTFELFSTDNAVGFFLRFRLPNGHVQTVMPSAPSADGTINCTYIEYMLVGATDPNRTEGWQWHEVAGGRIVLQLETSTNTSLDGVMAETYQMIGYTRSPAANPNFTPIRLTVP